MVSVNILFQSFSIGKIDHAVYFYFKDYKNHECNRDCTKSSEIKKCEYNFTVEWFVTMSVACLNCDVDARDCSRKYCIAADGVKRTIAVVNRMLPGPSIEVCKNDEIIVNVHNNLRGSEGNSIHWHGLRQKGTPYMDGLSMVTQCPILPQTTFQYKFNAVDVGTHHWHAHSAMQRADGIFGALIIRTATDYHANLYDVDSSGHVVIINDWLHEPVMSKVTSIWFGDDQENADGILINGKGLNVKDNSTTRTPLASFTVSKGKRYRFRIINSGIQLCPMQFSIDNHVLKVIATDGSPIQPIEVASLIIMQG